MQNPRQTAKPLPASKRAVDAITARAPGDWKRVADALQAEIILGAVFPRERMLEDDIMGRLGTTRHAARSALEELQRRGFVQREANRGARVRSYSRQEVEDLFELQEMLEALAIRRLPLPVADEIQKRLEAVESQQENARRNPDPLELSRCNRAFHGILFEGCGNARLAEAIATNALMIDPIRMRRNPDAAWRSEAASHHRQIIDALRDGDRKLLLRLCREHLEPAKYYYLSHHAAT